MVGFWGVVRVVFFQGLHGSDDMAHVIYAADLNRRPENHWESRLFYNSMLHASIRLFGHSEKAYALPGLLGSLALFGSTIFTGYGKWGTRGLVISGLLVASLPIDVVYATTPFASAFAVGWLAVGTAILLHARAWRGILAAAAVLALGILAHPMSVFFVLALCGSRALVLQNARERCAVGVCVILSIALFMAIQLPLYAAVTGNPFYEFELLRRGVEDYVDRSHPPFSQAWLLYPLRTFVFSKDFGIMPLLAVGGSLLVWKRLGRDERSLWLTCILFWLWIGYGSQELLSYVPFWRLTRYDYPLAMPLCLLVAAIGCIARRPPVLVTSLIVGLHLGLLAASGQWGEGANVSRELFHYMRQQPEAHFLTDSMTARDLYVFNRCEPLPNVSYYSPPESPARPDFPRVLYLWNPIYQPASPATLKYGTVRHATEPQLRYLAHIVPDRYVAGNDWWVRRPAGSVIEIER
jgi:hypothetical protein